MSLLPRQHWGEWNAWHVWPGTGRRPALYKVKTTLGAVVWRVESVRTLAAVFCFPWCRKWAALPLGLRMAIERMVIEWQGASHASSVRQVGVRSTLLACDVGPSYASSAGAKPCPLDTSHAPAPIPSCRTEPGLVDSRTWPWPGVSGPAPDGVPGLLLPRCSGCSWQHCRAAPQTLWVWVGSCEQSGWWVMDGRHTTRQDKSLRKPVPSVPLLCAQE